MDNIPSPPKRHATLIGVAIATYPLVVVDAECFAETAFNCRLEFGPHAVLVTERKQLAEVGSEHPAHNLGVVVDVARLRFQNSHWERNRNETGLLRPHEWP